MAASDGFEPSECQSQSLMPYRLATRQSKWWKDMDNYKSQVHQLRAYEMLLQKYHI